MADTQSRCKSQAPFRGKRQWLLVVAAGRPHDGLLHQLGLRPSKNDASQYLGFYALGAKPLMLRHIGEIRAAGLHGVAKQIPQRRATWSRPKAQRRPQAAAPSPDASIINLEIAKQNRLARDALKLATERRRQAEQAAEREANARARQAYLRAKGEV